MWAIVKREIKNRIKSPIFWIGVIMVILGIYQSVSPYLRIGSPLEETMNYDLPEMVHEGEVYEGYIPSTKEQQRKAGEKKIQETLILEFSMDQTEADAVINKIKDMEINEACEYLEREYAYYEAIYAYQQAAYHKGTKEEIHSYLTEKLESHSFSYYFSRKFADFTGLFMGFFATILLSVLFMQDTRKHTYELLHTKPISAKSYLIGKAAGGFFICLIVLGILNLVFWGICLVSTRESGWEVNLLDFIVATCLYIIPNMLMIVGVYSLISLLFQTPLPAVPLLFLYMVYSNMGSRNKEGVYGYYGRPLAIMVRFPGQFFDTAPPPMVLLNQSFLILASIGMLLLSIWIWKRRRM